MIANNKPIIEKITISGDKEEFNAEVKSISSKSRNAMIRRYYGGICHTCYEPPAFKVTHDMEGAKRLEFYCDSCYQQWQASQIK
jgi:hypothetical protein